MEIKLPLAIGTEEASLLNMHSVLNVLNVVQFEIMRLQNLCGTHSELDDLSSQLLETAESLSQPDEAIHRVRNVKALVEETRQVLQSLRIVEYGDNPEFKKIENNLEGIFAILLVRAGEIMERWDEPKAWKSHNILSLKRNFNEVFSAIEQNSHGAYHIVSNIAKHEDGDYLIVLDIDSENGETVSMPPVFQDVLRDLLANARKYTKPGGKIMAGLYQGIKDLRFVVEDSGIGIPEEEIEKVVQFGERGSNVSDRPTRGGGFGLTKAYYIARSFGGRMFISSPVFEGKGTRIEIVLPLP